MNKISEVARELPVSGIREIFNLASQIDSVIDLGIGEPDFKTPDYIIHGTLKAVKEGQTHYTATRGTKNLRSEIARKIRIQNGLDVNPESEIIVTTGAMGALHLSLTAVCDPGNEVILPDPAWPNYIGQIMMAQANLIRLPLSVEDGFKVNLDKLEKKITDKTKVLILNSPSNPTGALLERERLKKIAAIAKDKDIIVLSDEAYESLIYDAKRHFSIASIDGMFDRTVSIYTFSKTYAMTGWRVGYAAGPAEVISSMEKLQQHTVTCPSSVSQAAALAALTGPDEPKKEMQKEFDNRRTFTVERVNKIKGLSCIPPEGAFYCFVNVKQLGDTSRNIAMRFLKEGHVATIPGSSFGPQGEGYLRISFANSKENISEGLNRIEKVIKKFYI